MINVSKIAGVAIAAEKIQFAVARKLLCGRLNKQKAA